MLQWLRDLIEGAKLFAVMLIFGFDLVLSAILVSVFHDVLVPIYLLGAEIVVYAVLKLREEIREERNMTKSDGFLKSGKDSVEEYMELMRAQKEHAKKKSF